MTFEEIINAANRALPSCKYHVFGEYNDGHRGYFISRKTLWDAMEIARQINDPIIYDRDGKEVGP